MTIVRDFAENIQSDGDLIVSGDLQVSGTTTTVNSTTVEIGDKNIVLGANATANSQNDGGGISILLPDPSPDEFATFTHTGTTWNLSDSLSIDSGNLNIVSGNFQIGGTTVIDASQNATFAGGATFGGDSSVYTGALTGEFNVGRSSSQQFNFYVTDNQGYIRYYQEETDATNHSVNFQIISSSTGANIFKFNRGATFEGDIATPSGNVFVGKSSVALGTDGTNIAGTSTIISASSGNTYHVYNTNTSTYPFVVSYDGNVTAGTINSGAITSTGKISATQGGNFNTNTGAYPFRISRGGSDVSQVLSISITDTQALFNYTEDTSTEGSGNYGSYLFQVSGDSSPTGPVSILSMSQTNANFSGSISGGNLSADYSRLGRGFRTANRGELLLHSTAATDVSEILFGFGDGHPGNDSNYRWTISDRGTGDKSLIFYASPAVTGSNFETILDLDYDNSRVIITQDLVLTNVDAAFPAITAGTATQQQYTNIILQSDSGNAQIWKAGSLYTSFSGASSLNIYNSNGVISFHPQSVEEVLKLSSTAGTFGRPVIVQYSSNTDGTANGTTLLSLNNYVGSDIKQQKSFIDFSFTDDNPNEFPQVRIGAEVGENADANTQSLEGSGAFVVYTNDATTEGSPSTAATALSEKFRVDFEGTTTNKGKILVDRDVRSAGQIRATGWYGEAASTDYDGLAYEIGVSSGRAFGISYNRDTSSYAGMGFQATDFIFSGVTSNDTTFTFSSGVAGDATLIVEADTDNNQEIDLPSIQLKADGGIIEGAIGLRDNSLDIINSVSSGGGINLRVGTTDNTGTTDPATGTIVALGISPTGDATFAGDVQVNGSSGTGFLNVDSSGLNGSREAVQFKGLQCHSTHRYTVSSESGVKTVTVVLDQANLQSGMFDMHLSGYFYTNGANTFYRHYRLYLMRESVATERINSGNTEFLGGTQQAQISVPSASFSSSQWTITYTVGSGYCHNASFHFEGPGANRIVSISNT